MFTSAISQFHNWNLINFPSNICSFSKVSHTFVLTYPFHSLNGMFSFKTLYKALYKIKPNSHIFRQCAWWIFSRSHWCGEVSMFEYSFYQTILQEVSIKWLYLFFLLFFSTYIFAFSFLKASTFVSFFSSYNKTGSSLVFERPPTGILIKQKQQWEQRNGYYKPHEAFGLKKLYCKEI